MGRTIMSDVKVEDVFFDEELYPRSHYNWQTGYDYSQSMRCGAEFPPIILALLNDKKYLVDGKHRLEAHKLNKTEMIKAIIYTGWDKKKIFTESVKANIAHGRVLSPYEKRKIALKLIEMEMSNENVSKLIQVPEDKLENFISSRLVNSITGENASSDNNVELAKEIGKSILKSGLKHLAETTMSKEELVEMEAAQKNFYMMNQKSLLKQLIKIIEEDLFDKNDLEVAELVDKLKILLL